MFGWHNPQRPVIQSSCPQLHQLPTFTTSFPFFRLAMVGLYDLSNYHTKQPPFFLHSRCYGRSLRLEPIIPPPNHHPFFLVTLSLLAFKLEPQNLSHLSHKIQIPFSIAILGSAQPATRVKHMTYLSQVRSAVPATQNIAQRREKTFQTPKRHMGI